MKPRLPTVLLKAASKEVQHLYTRAEAAESALRVAREALEFYADPANWFGAYCTEDSPIAEDWDKVDHYAFPDGKPGKRARAALSKLSEARKP